MHSRLGSRPSYPLWCAAGSQRQPSSRRGPPCCWQRCSAQQMQQTICQAWWRGRCGRRAAPCGTVGALGVSSQSAGRRRSRRRNSSSRAVGGKRGGARQLAPQAPAPAVPAPLVQAAPVGRPSISSQAAEVVPPQLGLQARQLPQSQQVGSAGGRSAAASRRLQWQLASRLAPLRLQHRCRHSGAAHDRSSSQAAVLSRQLRLRVVRLWLPAPACGPLGAGSLSLRQRQH